MNSWQMQRRKFIVGIGSFSLLWTFRVGAQEKESKPEQIDKDAAITVSFVLPSNDESKLLLLAKQNGATFSKSVPFTPSSEEAESYPDPGFAPLVVIVGTLVVGYIAKISYGLWEDYNYGGLIVDASKNPIEIREHPALERGHVVVIKADGSIENLQPNNETELERILSNALS
jgi:hypothetical protein